ncbi:LRR receptor-like serine/threonine-protein kinase GSO2 [Sesamum indicum]|uniref:LRR receptor-like serine/threonine-protein kinase GSO2 n=1 Tax=Sesamum indicum TaxID=4182 RepID=A0A6I9T7L2_SESIN|nr:LRR receptor-like serine/threonine-protein kinase GSO2 [Sesamum indicum]
MKSFQLRPLLLIVFQVVTLKCGHSYSSQLNNTTNRMRCLDRERQALLNFKDELVDTYGRLSSWGNDEHKRECCEWIGVYCHNHTNHVTQLDLRFKFLRGKISTSLLELQQLEHIDLSFNDFEYAPIPDFIASLTQLQNLNLRSANFSGPIPHQIGNLSKLLYLDISANDCNSENLDWLFSLDSLEYLDLSYTDLSKATNWLQAVSKLKSIQELSLSNGALPEISLSFLPKINGSSPLTFLDLSFNSHLSNSHLSNFWTLVSWFSNFSSTGLSYIILNDNNIAGPIPDVFEDMMSLTVLSLYRNGLQGGIPKYFTNLSSLVTLSLSENNLSGDINEVMMNLSGGLLEKRLLSLDMSWNNFRGLLPNMSRFYSLTNLGLESNQLSGSIREGYLQLPSLAFLDLSSNGFTGAIPDLSFSPLLRSLRLSNNTFSGTLTHSIPTLSQLVELDLSFNSFLEVDFDPTFDPPFQLRTLKLAQCKLVKHYPVWLKTQKELQTIDLSSIGISDTVSSFFGGTIPTFLYLDASNNQMYGSFPNFSFSSTDFLTSPDVALSGISLDVSRNKISGSLDFLCYVKEWALLDLSDNLFSGQIPDCFASFRSLRYLNLANNHLWGKIPSSFGSLSALTLLHLRNNSLSDGIPSTMRNCRGLKMIDVGGNRLTGNIPSWIGESFPELIVLVLRSNEFYGDIPSNICRLANLQILDISANKNISTEHSSYSRELFLPTNTLMMPAGSFDSLESAYFMWKGNEVKYTSRVGLVKLIDFSDNSLVGEIPMNITKLAGLVALNISNNNLVGPIPQHIGELKSMNFLDLSRNHLSGGIPASLCNLNGLGVLNLSYNNLSGRIPRDNQCLTFEGAAYIGNVGLCGPPLNESCPGDHPNPRVEGAESDDDDKFITPGFYIALALGFIIGFWGIYGTILLNKTFRYAVFSKLTKAWIYFQN